MCDEGFTGDLCEFEVLGARGGLLSNGGGSLLAGMIALTVIVAVVIAGAVYVKRRRSREESEAKLAGDYFEEDGIGSSFGGSSSSGTFMSVGSEGPLLPGSRGTSTVNSYRSAVLSLRSSTGTSRTLTMDEVKLVEAGMYELAADERIEYEIAMQEDGTAAGGYEMAVAEA